MALLWLEGFDWIDNGTADADLDAAMARRYPNSQLDYSTGCSIETGRGGVGQCMSWRHYLTYFHTPALQTEQAGNTWIVGFAWRKPIYASGDNQFFQIKRSSNGTVFGLSYIGETYLRVDGQSELGRYDVLRYPMTWYYIEIKVTINNSPNGSWELRINGNTIDSATGVDTAYGSDLSDHVFFQGFGDSATPASQGKTDDIYICDASGSVNNDFLGPIVVRTISPDADGDDEQWATSSGVDSYALVNETSPADDDSDYIEDTTTGNRTLFTMGNVPSGMTGIVGVQQWTDCRVTDATSYDLKQTIKQNSTLYPNSAQTISSQSFAQYYDILETDPDTGVAWTESGLNAVQSGVEVG